MRSYEETISETAGGDGTTDMVCKSLSPWIVSLPDVSCGAHEDEDSPTAIASETVQTQCSLAFFKIMDTFRPDWYRLDTDRTRLLSVFAHTTISDIE